MNKNVLIGGVVVVLLVGGIALFRDDPAPAPRAAVSVPTTMPARTSSAMPTTGTSTITPTSTSSAASSTAAGRAGTKELCDDIDTADDRRIPVTDRLYEHVHRTEGWTWDSVKLIASAAATALDAESTTLLDTIRRSEPPTP